MGVQEGRKVRGEGGGASDPVGVVVHALIPRKKKVGNR